MEVAPRKRGEPREEMVVWRHSGNAEWWWGCPSRRGKGRGTVKLVLERWERLSAALQKLPVWALATRASHGRGPARLPAQRPRLALADLPECT